MEKFLLVEKDGPIVTLTMNRPEERNPLTGHFEEFVDACTKINADLSVKCVILTGAGPAFCAGGNVKDMRDKKGIASGTSREIMDGYRNGIQRIPLAFYHLEVPSIAAVNGAAIGAGNDLACMCDIRIASDTAVFAESFVKLGIIPGDGGAWLLPRTVGMSKAAEMTFTGDRIDAKEALVCGLVSRVVPAADLMKEARALAGRIASNPGVTLRMSKRLLREGQHMRIDSLLEMSAAFQAICHSTPEHEAAVQAFFDGRSGKK
ncbi:MAG: crotonase/enoyl-CoA hydratase family protein [Betaproteobacteria bacterium]|nr:crotonase/enoyl-CoA hydratase family protein [Betaproteobacteria bacterium]